MTIEEKINNWVDTCSSLTTLSELKEIGKEADKEIEAKNKDSKRLLDNCKRYIEIIEAKSQQLKLKTGIIGGMESRIESLHSDHKIQVECIADQHDQIEAKDKVIAELKRALKDCISGFDYIRGSYGDLYGVGFDRVEAYSELTKDKGA